MKKFIVIAGFVVVAVLALGAGNLAFAQSETPPPYPNQGYGYGRMGGRGGYGGMWSGLADGETGPYHEFMLENFAEGLELTAAQIQNRLEAGETMWQIAESEGLSSEDFRDLMQQARTAMLDQAVEDGFLTLEQADLMQNRMNWGGQWSGYGDCHGYGVQEGFHRGHHGWWNSP